MLCCVWPPVHKQFKEEEFGMRIYHVSPALPICGDDLSCIVRWLAPLPCWGVGGVWRGTVPVSVRQLRSKWGAGVSWWAYRVYTSLHKRHTLWSTMTLGIGFRGSWILHKAVCQEYLIHCSKSVSLVCCDTGLRKLAGCTTAIRLSRLKQGNVAGVGCQMTCCDLQDCISALQAFNDDDRGMILCSPSCVLVQRCCCRSWPCCMS